MTVSAFDANVFLEPVLLSLRVSLVASVLVFALGVLAAWRMTRKTFRGRTLLDTLFMLPLVLPPTVIGFILLVGVGRKSQFGLLIEAWFGQTIVFTWWGAVLAAVVMAFPLVYQTAKVGFISVDKQVADAARSDGAAEGQVFLYITLPLAARSLFTAFLLGFARALGEFGATLMVAGNIPGRTQTVPTAIYIAVESGNLAWAWYWTGAIILISFLVLTVVNRKVA
ncbi:molybdate ABC transporter permease subunit [Paenibacillus contaminans]|uniref:Molybdenum transport system permease n=1 Tax=Paenibacillus contaminans TaxID=450362 RepID=A0A329LJP9_9BACL|nr:molybdate ABC transporter permease subunit [Paenibacillus contaminans]RAV08465.1 molybdate ABC transporter permease subunit [Paenibacillus contaminans]